MAKNKGVAYVPITNPENKQAEKTTNAEISNYQEPGVRFAKYAKTSFGNGSYKLFPQDVWHDFSNFLWNASNVGYAYPVIGSDNDYNKRKYYINQIVFTSLVNADTFWYIVDYITGNEYVGFHAKQDLNNTITFDFSNNPLPLQGRYLLFRPYQPAGGGPLVLTGQLCVNISGFFEEKG